MAQSRDKRLTQTKHKPPNYLSTTLDGLNAFGVLEEVQIRPPASVLCFGPTAIHGALPEPWMAVVVWYRPPGIYQYKTITLLGIWAFGSIKEMQIVIGTKSLNYSRPFYNAESYFHQIQHNFETHYNGNAGVPTESSRLYHQPYDMTRRLEMRKALEQIIQTWRERQRGDGQT